MLRRNFLTGSRMQLCPIFLFLEVFRETEFLLFPLYHLKNKMKNILYKLLGFRIYLSFNLDEKNYNCKCQSDRKKFSSNGFTFVK